MDTLTATEYADHQAARMHARFYDAVIHGACPAIVAELGQASDDLARLRTADCLGWSRDGYVTAMTTAWGLRADSTTGDEATIAREISTIWANIRAHA